MALRKLPLCLCDLVLKNLLMGRRPSALTLGGDEPTELLLPEKPGPARVSIREENNSRDSSASVDRAIRDSRWD